MSDATPATKWPEYEYQLSTGAYGGLDDRFKLRRKKHPIGFAPPQPTKQRAKPQRPKRA